MAPDGVETTWMFPVCALGTSWAVIGIVWPAMGLPL